MTSSSFLLVPLLSLLTLNPYEAVEPHMGTLFSIKLYAPDEATAQQAFRAAFARIADLDNTLSDYKPQSELSRVTQEAVGHPIRVSIDLFRIVQAAQQLSQATDGAFDLTIGPLTHLWRKARQSQTLPDPTAIQFAKDHTGYKKLHLDFATHSLEFNEPGMLLDAGGIAKGYAADEALAVIENLGLHSALVAASGDLAFGDAPPGKPGWSIGINSSDQTMMLTNAAVSTSGNSEQHVTVNGKTYSHIIDPGTGMGLTDDITVTTVARRGIIADPAATAISVLGCEKGMAYAKTQPGLKVFIQLKNNNDR